MFAINELDTLLRGIHSGRMNVRWASLAKQYVLEHDEGIQLLLQHLEPHFAYIDTAIILPMWDGCCQRHPDILEEFLDIVDRSNPSFGVWVALASSLEQPRAWKAVSQHLAKTGREEQLSRLGPAVAPAAVSQAIYPRSTQESPKALLDTLLAEPNACQWLTIQPNERPMPWVVLWAKTIEPVENRVNDALAVLDVLIGKGVEINIPSPDNADCWVLEELCYRYPNEPLGVGLLIEALIERGAKTGGLTLGSQVQAFLDKFAPLMAR